MSSELKSEDIVKKAYYYCNNCGYNEIIKNNTIIFNTRSEQNDNVIVKQHYLNFKYDNTLPISKKYNCINNDCNTQKTKHIDIRYNLVREQVQKNNLSMIHLSTKDMTSDILTKALAPSPFIHLRKKLLGMYTKFTLSNLIM